MRDIEWSELQKIAVEKYGLESDVFYEEHEPVPYLIDWETKVSYFADHVVQKIKIYGCDPFYAIKDFNKILYADISYRKMLKIIKWRNSKIFRWFYKFKKEQID